MSERAMKRYEEQEAEEQEICDSWWQIGHAAALEAEATSETDPRREAAFKANNGKKLRGWRRASAWAGFCEGWYEGTLECLNP